MEISAICKAALQAGNFDLIIDKCPGFLGGVIGGVGVAAIVFLLIFLVLLIIIPLYIYISAAWWTIAKKLNNKNAWIAWIPIARWGLILQMGGYHWAWVFLALIPIFGWIALWILLIISSWIIFEKRNYAGWLSLAVIIPQIGELLKLIIIGFVAFRDIPIKNNKGKRDGNKKTKMKKKLK